MAREVDVSHTALLRQPPYKSPHTDDQLRGYLLFQSEGTTSYNAAINRYANGVLSGPERTHSEIIDVLAVGAVYAEVQSCVSRRHVRALVD